MELTHLHAHALMKDLWAVGGPSVFITISVVGS
jgi:hypothetical protein